MTTTTTTTVFTLLRKNRQTKVREHSNIRVDATRETPIRVNRIDVIEEIRRRNENLITTIGQEAKNSSSNSSPFAFLRLLRRRSVVAFSR